MAGDAKRRVPIQKKKEEINIMDIIDFHTHPYLTQEENACMYREGFSLEPEEAKEDLLQAGIGRICGSVIRPRNKFDRRLGFSQIQKLNDSALRLSWCPTCTGGRSTEWGTDAGSFRRSLSWQGNII